MMSEQEIEIINDLLRVKQSKNCLEWGSGNSTMYFPRENSFIKKWLAIEHNKTYYELLNDKLPVNAEIKVVESSNKYIRFPLYLDYKFDFILVDGNFRDECMEIAFQVVEKDGIILLHDAFRAGSEKILKRYKGRYKKLSEGEKLLKNGFYAHRGLISFENV